ncbi:hypothetical protein [Prosthecobacter sp.]|uniref:hypothetical protein n=1 Tax=Prosthecobacter sp. TaxID=1965333 RepID=UPI0037832DE0
MKLPATIIASLVVVAASLHIKAEEVGWYEMLSRIRTTSVKGLIYPADGKQNLVLSSALNWGDPQRAADSAYWQRTLNDEVLSKLGGKALQEGGGTVLLADQNAVRLNDLMTRPVKKGDYTGFDFLTEAASGVLTLSRGGFGGQLMGRTFHIEEEVPSQKLGELMCFLCEHLKGNYWSLSPVVSTDKEGKILKEGLPCVLPVVSKVVPASSQPAYNVKELKQD